MEQIRLQSQTDGLLHKTRKVDHNNELHPNCTLDHLRCGADHLWCHDLENFERLQTTCASAATTKGVPIWPSHKQ